MTFKRIIAEVFLKMLAIFHSTLSRKNKLSTNKIFILRNNGLGDLLCITPLFEILKKRFPDSKIIVGIGDWHNDLLDGNPHIDKQIRVNAPWHNQFTGEFNILTIIKYILFSSEIKKLKLYNFDIGIDILGSFWGSLLLLRLNIPRRFGVKGYGGGHSATEKYIIFDESTHVTTASLKFGTLIGTDSISYSKPQIYLTKKEKKEGDKFWLNSRLFRVVIAPGGSFEEKCWPKKNFSALAEIILNKNITVIYIGDSADAFLYPKRLNKTQNLIGKTTLRQSCSIIASSDVVICNSSFVMHVAAAFDINNLVLLGKWYESAQAHKDQWGHEKTTIIGVEQREGINEISSVQQAFITSVRITKDFSTKQPTRTQLR